VSLPIGAAEWIILDTSIVRGLIEGELGSINVEELQDLRGQHRIALADAAPAEIVYWLERAPDKTIRKVRPALKRLDQILDPEFPIAPSPQDIGAFAGLVPYRNETNPRELSLFANALWKNLKTIRWRKQVSRDLRYRNSSGALVVKHFQGPEHLLRQMEQDWIAGPIAEIASQFGYPEVTEKDEERLTTDIRSQAARSIHLPVLATFRNRADPAPGASSS